MFFQQWQHHSYPCVCFFSLSINSRHGRPVSCGRNFESFFCNLNLLRNNTCSHIHMEPFLFCLCFTLSFPFLRYSGRKFFYHHSSPFALWSSFEPLSLSWRVNNLSKRGDDRYMQHRRTKGNESILITMINGDHSMPAA